MKQAELNREVANATGETIAEVRRRGFVLADPVEVDFDPEPYDIGRHVNWDTLEQQRWSLLPG